MTIRIYVVGKTLDKSLAAVVTDFEKRLLPQIKLEWQLIAPSNAGSPEACREAESNTILTRLKSTDQIILLDERGQMPDNVAFAEQFEQWSGRQGQLVFVVGGAFGVSDELREKATYVWSLSPLVFPHQLVRVMLVEQLYRTTAILSNHPYHHV